MPEGEDYKAKYPNTLRQKLFIPRDREGNVNSELFEVVRMLESTLEGYPGFVGVAPMGSALFGYANMPGAPERGSKPNDIDVAFFFDSSVRPNVGEELKDAVDGKADERYDNSSDLLTHNPLFSRLDKLGKFFVKLRKKIAQPNEQEPADKNRGFSQIHAPKNYYFDIRLDKFSEFVAKIHANSAILDDKNFSKETIKMLSILSWVVVGPAVNQYRLEIGKLIMTLNTQTLNQIVEGIAQSIVWRERAGATETGASKRDARMLQHVSRESVQSIESEREDMWKKRVRKVFGIT
jgi:hypothetical protein